MSLINQMLKDLEKRRSRDLETSPTLNRNINWETRPDSKTLNWGSLLIIVVMLLLLGIIGYLVWERTVHQQSVVQVKAKPASARIESVPVPADTPVTRQKNKPITSATKVVKPENKPAIKKQPAIQPADNSGIEEVVKSKAYAEAIETEGAIDTDTLVSDIAPAKLNKKIRALSSEQKAEIIYQEAYSLLQQNNPVSGKRKLQEALAIYPSHIKAREILAGIYIKSGHFIDAASLLKDGVRLVPEYSLFAKLYARVLLEQNKPHEAIRVLEKGATVLEVEPDYYALLAATYQRVRQHEKAIKLYLQLVKLQPGAGVWWLGLGISLEKSGKNAEALEAFHRSKNTGSLNPGLLSFASKRISILERNLDQSN